MSLEKSRLRMLIAEEIGRGLEEQRDALEKMVLKQEGARDGLKKAVPGITDLMAALDAEFKDKGMIGGVLISDIGGEPVRLVAAVKRYLQRAIGVVDNLATTAEVAMMVTSGQVKGMNGAISHVKGSFYDKEKAKLEAVEKGIADGSIVVEDGRLVQKDVSRESPRIPGMHPGETLKMQRQAEGQAEGQVVQPVEPPAQPEPEVMDVAKPKKPRVKKAQG